MTSRSWSKPAACLAKPLRIGAAALLLCGSAALSGCSSMIADHLPASVGGLPEGSPERAANAPAYPAVHDMPPARTSTTLSQDEQQQLANDLIAARAKVDASTAEGGSGTSSSGGSGSASAGTAKKP